MSSLLERARALNDERLIKRTLYQCARALDYGHAPKEFLDCFTRDGCWWSESPEIQLEGLEQLEHQFVESASTRGTPGHFTHHTLWNTLIDLDSDKATAESYTATLAETPDGPLMRSMGRYLDRLLRCSDGIWRIDERHEVIESETR
jgi:hypothetical protein